CSLGSPFGGVIVAADTAARRFLADFSGLSVLDVVDLIGRDGAAATLRRLGAHGVRLRSRTTSPTRQRIGIYGNRGTTHGAVFVSAAGHRLFGEVTGDVVRTNVLGGLFELGSPPLPSGAALP